MNLSVDTAIKPKRVLILGAGGHDGPFLCRTLSARFEVIAHTRELNQRLQNEKVETIVADLADLRNLMDVVSKSQPDYVVNLVSLSSVFECQKNPQLSYDINFKFVTNLINILESYSTSQSRNIRFLQASSSEIFGSNEQVCDEMTNLAPISQYGKDKALAHEFLQDYSSQSIEIKRAILFNHESEYRKSTFVSQKIAIEAAKYRLGRRHELLLGNVHSARDWGYAPDYMDALSLMLEREGNETYVVASGELHTIQELIQIAFGASKDFDLTSLYSTDLGLFRKNETKPLVGSSNKLVKDCGWKPKVGFESMIEKMVKSQMANLK